MEYFCSSTIEVWDLVGTVLTFLKIGIPLIIVILAVIDLGKAAISSKDDEMKKAFTTLLRRVVAGLIIFFIPTIVDLLFNLVSGFGEATAETDYNVCTACISGGDCYVADGYCSSEGVDSLTSGCSSDDTYYNGN